MKFKKIKMIAVEIIFKLGTSYHNGLKTDRESTKIITSRKQEFCVLRILEIAPEEKKYTLQNGTRRISTKNIFFSV